MKNKKIVTKLRFIYSILSSRNNPKDEMDEDDEENLAGLWIMDEEITDSSDDNR